MIKNNTIGLILLSIILLMGCKNEDDISFSEKPNYKEAIDKADFLHRSMKQLTDIIVHDIFSPPVASRVYVYPSIAAYEALRHDHPNYQSFAGQLNGLKAIPQPNDNEEYAFTLASVHAFLEVGKTLIFSEQTMKEFQAKIYKEFRDLGIPKAVYERSMAYGKTVANHILAYADKDNYKQTRTFPKFDINWKEADRWQPTPPDYMDGIEPHWRDIRPFVLDSAQQFTPPVPTKYDMAKNSQFYKELMVVYETGKNLDEEQTAIAKFWDCNPYATQHTGHAMTASKKITPGGHWVGITTITCKKTKANIMRTAESYAIVTIALADGFISCWDEKYRSNLIRPETLINKHIDQNWQPLLQTPPFPEYTSGHSVISSAAAIALTKLYGENFSFLDTSEEEYGLPARTFPSFIKASEEAAISRLYGGIHYMPAIDNGVTQGRALGRYVVDKIKTTKEAIGQK